MVDVARMKLVLPASVVIVRFALGEEQTTLIRFKMAVVLVAGYTLYMVK